MCKDKYCKEVFAEFDKLHDYYIGEINKYKKCLDEINEICSNSLSVKLLFKDRMDLAIFIRKRIKEVKKNNG